MSEIPEPRDWSQVAALFESLKNDIGAVADGLANVQTRLGRIETSVDVLAGEVKDLKGWFQAFNTRLTTTEAKLPA